MKNLENYGVQELNANEINEIDGGGSFVKLVASLFGKLTEYYYRGGGVQSQYGVS